MLLTELLGVKRFHNLTKIELLRMLNNANEMGTSKLKFIGKGTNGTVLSDGSYVWKLWLRDSSYEAFINFVIANQGNPFLPKVHSGIKTLTTFHRRIVNTPNRIKYIKLEKLREVPRENSSIVTQLGTATVSVYSLVNFILSNNIASISDEELGELIKELRFADDINDEVLLLAKTALKISALMRDGGHENDLTPFNFMLRDDGTPVIIDPFANIDDHNFNRYLEKMDNILTKRPDVVDEPVVTGPS